MRFFLHIQSLIIVIALLGINTNAVFAVESYVVNPVHKVDGVRFNNENWHTMPHPTIASFKILENGDATGFTVTGIPFSQYTVPNDVGIRVQRFEIQDHYHYIVDGEIVYTFAEFSSILAAAYAAQSNAI